MSEPRPTPTTTEGGPLAITDDVPPRSTGESRMIVDLNDESLVTAGTVEDGTEVDDRIELNESAVIENGAVVRGPVFIAENT